MSTYYKAVRPDGTDFYSGTVDWARPGEVVTHPNPHSSDARGYLSVATVPTECAGFGWPCRLFTVQPVDGREVVAPEPFDLPDKRASSAWRVVAELPAHRVFGPEGVHVVRFLDGVQVSLLREAGRLDPDAAAWWAARDASLGAAAAARDASLGAARDAVWDATRGAYWDAARDAYWDAARDAYWTSPRAVWDAVWDAAAALLVRDLIPRADYDALTLPWRTVVGPIHPDDPDVLNEVVT